MITNIQAVSTIALHHALLMQSYFGGATTLDDVVAQMQADVGDGSDMPFICPKCKGQGDYLPSVDGETYPFATPLGNVLLADNKYLSATELRITCSVCSGTGYTVTQVIANPGEITYENATP